MAEKKAKGSVDSKIVEEEEVTTQDKVEAAKQANVKAAKATREAAKANAEATAAVAKDTAKKTKKVATDAAKKGATVTKDTAKKAAGKATEAAEKVKETSKSAKSTYTRKPKRNVFIQYLGREMTEDELVERAIAQFGATEGSIPVKKISLYIKPEELAAYYVINEQYTGRVDF